MRKRFLIGAALLAALGGLAILLVNRRTQSDDFWSDARGQLTEREIRDALVKRQEADPTATPAVTSLKESQVVRLAIGGLGFAEDARNRLIGDLTVAELADAKGIELVDRQSLDVVIREMQLNLSGLVRARDAIRIGSLVRADWFLLGGVSSSGQDKAVIARIVDAHTGIMRDVTVIKDNGDTLRLAQALAAFARQCRQDATNPKRRTFLAIGSFADLSINNRQADFPARLRAGLTAAFQDSDLTLLERDHVNTLLQEVRLDLAGMTDGGTNRPATMQSAFWIVDGYYQSIENSGFEVELIVRVKPLFARAVTQTLRGQPQEGLIGQVKGFIDATLAKAGPSMLVPTRRSEIQTQMSMGRELLELNSTGVTGGNLTYSIDYQRWAGFDPREVPRRRRNYEEAIRAFEAVLLLEPENRQAKMYLAACLRESIVGRIDEARSLYQEIIGSSQRDQWTTNAMLALASTYLDTDPREAGKWFRAAGALNWEEFALTRAFASEGVKDKQTLQIVEAGLFGRIRATERGLQGKGGVLDFGMHDFVRSFGTNAAEGATRLAALLPKLQETFPDLAPHLLAAVVPTQVDTNAPVLAEFRRTLKQWMTQPEKLKHAAFYFDNLIPGVYYWSVDRNQYALTVELGEARRQASLEGHGSRFDEQNKVELAFAYVGLERWQDALNVFQSLGDEPIRMSSSGPWGRAFDPFAPSKAVTLCRAKLGLPDTKNAKHFDLGAPCLHIHESTAFTMEGDTLWLATGAQLMRLDASLKTNAVITLPKHQFTPVTALCISPERIWLGTAGDGLIEYDRTNGQCRRIEEKDGLLIDEISRLHRQESSLWIGYGRWDVNGRRGSGGLGLLDLQTRRLSSFTPALSIPEPGVAQNRRDAPPRTAVFDIVSGLPGDVWVISESKGTQRFSTADSSWASPAFGSPFHPTCLAVGGDHLFVGKATYKMGETSSQGGVQTLGLKDGQLKAIGETEQLPRPRVTTLTVDGNDLWVGGEGYVAVVDLAQWTTRKVCYITAREVDHIEVAGGFVWVQYGGHLYKAPLKSVE